MAGNTLTRQNPALLTPATCSQRDPHTRFSHAGHRPARLVHSPGSTWVQLLPLQRQARLVLDSPDQPAVRQFTIVRQQHLVNPMTKHMPLSGSTLIPCLLAALISAPLHARQPAAYGLGHPFELEQLPFGTLRDRLESLPEPAGKRAMAWLHRFSFTDQDLPFLRVDNQGGVFYADNPENTDTVDTSPMPPVAPASAMGAAEAFSLHSRPGATNTLYLDFDGHLISGTAWSSTDLEARPYDIDGDPTGFSQTEIDNIAEIWRRIAEDFAPFDIDVTTESPVTFGPSVGRVLITEDTDAGGQPMPSQGAGGVAYVNVWGRSDFSSRYSPALVYFNNLGGGRADYVTEAASHEAGHNLGLSHDATSTSSYYGGHGSGAVSWGPIMGTGYNRNVSQWSKGEYADASNQQDDLSILDSKLGMRGDDHADTLATASRLVFDATGNVTASTPADDPQNMQADNKGVIESAVDLDVFYFDTPGGNLGLAISPAWQARYTRGANLDIHAALYDVNGSLLQESDNLSDTDSSLSASLPAGRYYVAVQGVGNSQSPYTAYGSIGQYFISGSIPAIDDNTAPVPDPMAWLLPPGATGRDTISMSATVATDDSGTVEYYFDCVSGPAGCTASGWQSASSFTASGLQPGASYSWRVFARDAYLNETAGSVEAAAVTLDNQPPVAADDSASTEQDSSVTISVLANDTDPEQDALAVISYSQGSNGSVSGSSGSLVYTPDPGFTGTDSISYTIGDGFGATAMASVSITVTAINQSPVATPDSISISPGDTVIIDVLANDSDPEGELLVITAVTGANKGSVSWQPGDSTISYSHNPRRKGSDSFSYTVSDGQGGSATTTVSISLGDSGGETDGGGGGTRGGGKGKKK